MKSRQPAAGEQKKPGNLQDIKLKPVRAWLFGGFRVSVGSRTIGEEEWRLRKAANLVKLLALEPYHRLHREVVMELLWPELGPEAAANNLYRALYFARQALNPDPTTRRYVELRNEQLTLCPDSPLWVDVQAFEESAEEARRIREPAAYRAAIELYAGDLLPEDRYEEWAEERRAQLRETYLELLIGLARSHEEHKECEKGIEALRKAVAEEPTRVEAHAGLMRLYALCGRRAEALDQYQRLEEILSEQLGVEPDSETRLLREEIASGRFPPPAPTPEEHPLDEHAGAHNLPLQRTSFVGRESEMVELKRLLSMTGMLTLTGAGGAGKTRLALEVARELVGVYPDGVWLVELAPISDADLVAGQVARALGMREQPERPLAEMLVEYLRKKKALLILDNCEHLVDAAADLADVLLGSCPRLKILATSREPLGVAGEINWRIPSLSMPTADSLPADDDLMRYESVRLFVERARSRLPTFELTPENARAIVEVCWKLDGIPLAIELATARMTTLAVEQVAQRLEDSLRLLTGGTRTVAPRQQTMRATLQWSYVLLEEAEKRLFARLSVFAGGLSLEAAETVGAGDGIGQSDVLDLLNGLVDKSLVVAEASPGVETLHSVEASHATSLRYRMLEPVRQFAQEKLEECRESAAVRRRHAEHYLALGERARRELGGPDQAEWLTRLETEYDNIAAALSWSLDQDQTELGLRLASAIGRFWCRRRYQKQGRRWLDALLAKSKDVPVSVRARALYYAGAIADGMGDIARAEEVTLESLKLYRADEDDAGVARALFGLGGVAFARGEAARARTLYGEALELFRTLGDDDLAALTLMHLGEVALFAEGDHELARSLYEESLALFRKIGGTWGGTWCLWGLGNTALQVGDHELAKGIFTEALSHARGLENPWLVASLLEGLAGVITAQGQAECAATLWGAAEILREEVTAPMSAYEQAAYERAIGAARAQLDEATLAAAWQTGRAMSLKQAIEYALTQEEPQTASPQPPAANVRPAALTPREREVATLVSRGLTNRQIAQELHLSNRTVDTHVGRILHKLGLHSRARISDWLTQQQPPEE